MRKLILSIIILQIAIHPLFAQVQLQTGSAVFPVPVFNWKDNKSRLNMSISLNYSSGQGLKTDEVASSVGQGWNLLAGGVVTRMQVGEPDDQKPRHGNGNTNDITRYPPGYLYDTASVSKGIPLGLNRYPLFTESNMLYKERNAVVADRELDYFVFQFNGRNGTFIVGKNNGDVGTCLEQNNLKVWYERNENMGGNTVNQGIRTTITAFYIQDENGLIYKFKKHGLSKLLKKEYCNESGAQLYHQPNIKKGRVYYEGMYDKQDIINPYVINNWYLSEIEDALTGRKVLLNYETRYINSAMGASITQNDQRRFFSMVSFNKTVSEQPAISNIIYPDGHQVNFLYGKPRVDLTGDFALDAIDVKLSTNIKTRFKLHTSYAILNRYGNPVTDFQKSAARLYLLSIKQLSAGLKGENPEYRFDYYRGAQNNTAGDDFIPPAFYHMKDIWGYYNGNNSKTQNGHNINLFQPLNTLNNATLVGLCFRSDFVNGVVLNPKDGYAKNGLLRQIVYPTGSTITYEYEQNMAYLNGQYRMVGGVHVKNTRLTDGGYKYGCDNPLLTNYNYVDAYGSSSLWGVEMPNNKLVNSNSYSPKGFEARLKLVFSGGLTVKCDYRYKYSGIQSTEAAFVLQGFAKLMNDLQPIFKVLDVVSKIATVAQIISGTANPVALIIAFVAELFDSVYGCFANRDKNNDTDIYYNTDVDAYRNLPVQFKRVEVIQANGGTGKSVFEFTSSDDYAIWEAPDEARSMKQRYAPWAYGLPKKTSLYDSVGNIIKTTENYYNFSKAKNDPCATVASTAPNWAGPQAPQPCVYTCVKGHIIKSVSQKITEWEDPAVYNVLSAFTKTSTDEIKVKYYNIYSGRVELMETKETVYTVGNAAQYAEFRTQYQYDYYNYQVTKTILIQANGDRYITTTYYSNTGGNSAVIQRMLDNNMKTVPRTTIQSMIKAGAYNELQLSREETSFVITANGDVKPEIQTVYRSASPVSWITTGKQAAQYKYAADGKMIGMIDEGGRTVTSLYDYEDRQAVASVINADPIADKSFYSSFETISLGNFTPNASVNSTRTTTQSVTGNYSVNLSGISLQASGLNTSKPYRVTVWATATLNFGATAASLVNSGPTVGGFTFYEYSIPQGTSSLEIAGSGFIDELRVYPQTARMRTVSYDELYGKTSECDENNRITYYEYDDLGRLKMIKDQNKHTVKMYEYNTISNQQIACPQVYYNSLIAEVFVKNNCSNGFAGGEVTYTIPYAKYSSTISQEDADAKAEAELMELAQTYANTNGACIPLYYNVQKVDTFYKENCPPGYLPTPYLYTVAAGKFSSTISQEDADEKAQDEIDANGQVAANNNPNGCGTTHTDPEWVTVGEPQFLCGSGSWVGHKLVLLTDINPFSLSYNTQQWVSMGIDPSCNPPGCTSCPPGEGYRCINGYCEYGIKIYDGTYEYDPNLNRYYCIYYYEFSDGSRTHNYHDVSTGGSPYIPLCPVN